MNKSDGFHFKLVITSSPSVLIPAMMQNAAHIYRTGDKEAAINMVLEYFNDVITQEAIVSILTDSKLPIFDVDDLMHDTLSYYFEKEELSAQALKEMGIE